MTQTSEQQAVQLAVFDDRSPYGAAESIVETIAELCPELRDADAVWEAFTAWKDRDLGEYIQTIRRTRHSIFFYQLMELCDFGRECAGAARH